MGAWYSSQTSQSIFLVGNLNGKPDDEKRFFLLSQDYLDQTLITANGINSQNSTNHESDRGDNSQNSTNHERDRGDNSNVTDVDEKETTNCFVTVPLFQPLPQTKKLYCHQTYTGWKSSLDLDFLKQFFTSPKRVIYLVQIDTFPDFVNDFKINIGSKSHTLFEFIREFLEIYFMGMDVRWLERVDLENTDWNIRERCHLVTEQLQFRVTDFFKPLQTIKPSDGYCIMGMTWTDLYPEEKYNFALGEAAYRYRSGVFSFGRFSLSTFDPDNPKDITEITSDLLWKLIKVSSHELGHLFGLDHCEFFSCHMNESLSIIAAMDQPLFFCPVCLRKIQHICQFNVSERFEKLEIFIEEVNKQFPSEKWSQCLNWLKRCRTFLSINTVTTAETVKPIINDPPLCQQKKLLPNNKFLGKSVYDMNVTKL